MPRFPTRPALALLGALFCLAACAPTATVSVSAAATTPSAPTATPTLAPAPTPTNVPAGWKVLATTHFSLAYPPDWTLETLADQQAYTVWAPAKQDAVQVRVLPRADLTPSSLADVQLYCQPESHGARPTTFANLPMTLQLTGLGNTVQVWRFANAQRTLYLLQGGNTAGDSATQAQDTAILATFRPDDATPWQC